MADSPMAAKAFCDLTQEDWNDGMTSMSGVDEASPTMCDSFTEMHDFVCNGLCSDACLNSEVMGQMSGVDESQDPAMALMGPICADICFQTFASKMVTFEKKETQCMKDGKQTNSMNDEADGDGGGGDDGGDGGGAYAAEGEEELMSVEDTFLLGCATNDEGENCIDKMQALLSIDGGEFPSAEDSDDFCASRTVTDIVSLGCCFGTMAVQSAWDEPPAHESAKLETERMDKLDFVGRVAECPGGRDALVPCTKNAMADMTQVSSEVTVKIDFETMKQNETKATKDVVRSAIAEDLGVQEQQVIVYVQVKDARRLDDGMTNIEYTITLNPKNAQDDKVEDKINGGGVKSKTIITKAATSGNTPTLSALTASEIAPSTMAASTTTTAAPPAAFVPDAGDSGMSTGSIVGIVVGALCAVAAVSVGSLMVITKSRQAKAPALVCESTHAQATQAQATTQEMSNPASTL